MTHVFMTVQAYRRVSGPKVSSSEKTRVNAGDSAPALAPSDRQENHRMRHAATAPRNGVAAQLSAGDEMIKKAWPLLRPVTLRDCGHTHAKSCSHEPRRIQTCEKHRSRLLLLLWRKAGGADGSPSAGASTPQELLQIDSRELPCMRRPLRVQRHDHQRVSESRRRPSAAEGGLCVLPRGIVVEQR